MSAINPFDPNDVFSYGQGNLTYGLVVGSAVNGFGLVTRGFLWQAHDIWLNLNNVAGVSTSWSLPSGYTTLTTTWTPMTSNNEVPPILW